MNLQLINRSTIKSFKIVVVAIAPLAPPLVTAVLRILILYEFIMTFNRAEFY
jgi:hypothetical protein